MPVTVTAENGTGLANANAYATTSDADGYFATRPRSEAWLTADADQKARLLIQATQILDASFRWAGERANGSQALAFPRYSRDFPNVLDGASVPAFLKTALFELALFITGEDPTTDGGAAGVKVFEVGSLKVDFDPSHTRRFPRWLEDLIQPYGTSLERSASVPIRRA